MFNQVLWIVQVFTAVIFVITGGVKVFLPKERLQRRMHWAKAWPAGRVKLLGAAELAGAAGLILPQVTGLFPVLVPIAAVCLALLMAGAVRTHHQLGEGVAPALIICLLCVVIAVAGFI